MKMSWGFSARSMKFRLLVPIAVLVLVLGTFGSYSPAKAQSVSGGATTNGPLTMSFGFTTDNVHIGVGCAFTGFCGGFMSAQAGFFLSAINDQLRSTSIQGMFFPQTCNTNGACEGGTALLFGSGFAFTPPLTSTGVVPITWSAIVNDNESSPSSDSVLLFVCFGTAFSAPQPCGFFSPPDYVNVYSSNNPNQIEVNPQPTLFDRTALYKTVKSKLPALEAKYAHR